MPVSVNVHDAKTQFSKLLERAHGGEEIILAKAGKPYARMMPIEAQPKLPPRTPGGLKIKGDIPDSVWFDPLPEDELAAWEGKYSSKL
jgi:prevent-host-death family protein